MKGKKPKRHPKPKGLAIRPKGGATAREPGDGGSSSARTSREDAEETNLESLPNELILKIIEPLSYTDLLAIGATNRRLHALSTLCITPEAERAHRRVAAQWFRRYRQHDLCRTCERLLPNACFFELRPSSAEMLSLGDRWAGVDPRCIECIHADTGGVPRDKTFYQRETDQWVTVETCPCCELALAQPLSPPARCDDCKACWRCLEDWKLDYAGFCVECRRWRELTLVSFERYGYPDYYDPDRRGWRPRKVVVAKARLRAGKSGGNWRDRKCERHEVDVGEGEEASLG